MTIEQIAAKEFSFHHIHSGANKTGKLRIANITYSTGSGWKCTFQVHGLTWKGKHKPTQEEAIQSTYDSMVAGNKHYTITEL